MNARINDNDRACKERRMSPRLYTIAEAAELLRVSRGKIYQLIRAGVLVSVLLGARSRRVTEESILRLLEDGGNR